MLFGLRLKDAQTAAADSLTRHRRGKETNFVHYSQDGSKAAEPRTGCCVGHFVVILSGRSMTLFTAH